MNEIEIDLSKCIDNFKIDKDKVKQYGGYKKIANDLSKENMKLAFENTILQSKIDKVNELIKRKLSTETYQHLKKLYDDIDSTEEIWEDYEFEDLLDILKEEKTDEETVQS